MLSSMVMFQVYGISKVPQVPTFFQNQAQDIVLFWVVLKVVQGTGTMLILHLKVSQALPGTPKVNYFPISSSLDFGLRYAIEEMTSGSKRPWFDSYEEYIKDIKGLTKEYSILPEFRISDQMNYYISASNGNFRAKNTSFLSLDGVGQISRSSDIENTRYNSEFFRNYINSDIIKTTQIIEDNKSETKLNKIIFKLSGIKKLLPYNGFYPIQRTIQLASLYGKFVRSCVLGGFLNVGYSKIDAVVGNESELFFSIKTNLSGGIDQLASHQTALEPIFAPGILYNTIKSGIGVSWPTITRF